MEEVFAHFATRGRTSIFSQQMAGEYSLYIILTNVKVTYQPIDCSRIRFINHILNSISSFFLTVSCYKGTKVLSEKLVKFCKVNNGSCLMQFYLFSSNVGKWTESETPTLCVGSLVCLRHVYFSNILIQFCLYRITLGCGYRCLDL